MNEIPKKILIVGGGFGGISTALKLEKSNENISVVLVSDKSHFEYKPALYKVVTGHSPLEVCIPISEIFPQKNIKIAIDTIEGIDLNKKTANGKSGTFYKFDYIVLALGSQTVYFDIPGLEEHSYRFKTIAEAMRLKVHIHDLFKKCSVNKNTLEKKECLPHIVVVGAGPSGVELVAELAIFTKDLAHKYEADYSHVTIDLVEAESRIIPTLPEKVSRKVEHRLRSLGVNIFINRPITEEDAEKVTIKGMTIKTKTVIWTSGVKSNSLYQRITGLEFDKIGRVIVNDNLQANGYENVFVVGDGASTPFSGMAQTAISDGKVVAKNIKDLVLEKQLRVYESKKPYYSLPVGPEWAATLIGPITFYGRIGWFFRRIADLRYFLSILPIGSAVSVYRRGRQLCKTCGICESSDSMPHEG